MLTTEELFREYIKLFTLIVETAGQTEGNKSYKEVTRVLKENEHIVKKIIEEEMSFYSICSFSYILYNQRYSWDRKT